MKNNYLLILIAATAISLSGILLTQTFWLKKTLAITQKQFDHRANQMLSDVVGELITYTDTAVAVKNAPDKSKLGPFDVIDTTLLDKLLVKYAEYHQLDTIFSYGLVNTRPVRIIYEKNNYLPQYEKTAYKLCLSCVWHKNYMHLSVFFPNRRKSMFGQIMIWIILSFIFIIITSVAFILIIYNFFRQKKLAEIKNDFINNMTHELKTPLSTISVASEILINTHNEKQNEKLSRYARIIFDENHRMRKLVDKVLNISTMERGNITIEKEDFDIHKLIYKVVEVFCVEACQKEVSVDYSFKAENSIIYADKMHIRNILNNLVDNAVKYSRENPLIKITTMNSDGYFVCSISDNGLGIPKESIAKVFDKFYRVPSGNIHNVKGFGLGLYYVKSMIEAHGGKVEINSVLNKGTTISLFLPPDISKI